MSSGTTLWIAILGVALGVASLTWHVVSFLLVAGRVKVSANPNMRLVDPASPAPGLALITLTVRNVGRMPVSVTAIFLTIPKTDVHLLVPTDQASQTGPSIPCTIEPGHAETWSVRRERTCEQLRRDFTGIVSLRPLVTMGTGRSKMGKAFELDLEETPPDEQ